MAKTFKDNRYIGRLGAPTNLRSGGVMRSANRLKDARRNRREAKALLHAGVEQ